VAVMFSISFAYVRIFHLKSNASFPKSHPFELAAQN
jgi:hypothetical protein